MYKYFLKNLRSKFFYPLKIKEKNFGNPIFSKNFLKIVLFQTKFEFRIILAFTWCTYCPYRWKIFSKINMPKNFGNKLGHFGRTLHQNYGSYDVAQGFYRLIKMPSFILDHFWMVWIKNWAIQAQKKRCLDSAHPTDRPKSPPWLGLKCDNWKSYKFF